MYRSTCVVFALGLMLAACGSTPQDRAVSGAGIGAAGGAIIGAITGLTVVEGAALGATGGALVGIFTDSDKLDLGEPIWKQGAQSGASRDSHGGTVASRNSHVGTSDPPFVRNIQSDLSRLGYDPGPVDGIMGPLTTSAIRRYQQDNGLLTDGRATWELAQHIQRNAE
ncbi:MAG: peptidoglycan-binding protein [Alphaproteobacteria bacterium]